MIYLNILVQVVSRSLENYETNMINYFNLENILSTLWAQIAARHAARTSEAPRSLLG